MWNKAVANYVHPLEFVPGCYMTQKMRNKVVNTYPSAKQFVPEDYKTQEMCDKRRDVCPFCISFSSWSI